MQELRLVLIIVGALAISALLFHGLWTSRKENAAKFGNKPLNKVDFDNKVDSTLEDVKSEPVKSEPVTKTRKEPGFNFSHDEIKGDPLLDGSDDTDDLEEEIVHHDDSMIVDDSVETTDDLMISTDEPNDIAFSAYSMEESIDNEPVPTVVFEADDVEEVSTDQPADNSATKEKASEEDMLVMHVHISGEERFSGPNLFDSLEQNGLLFGDMDIYHRHSDLSGVGEVLFSVANMVAPGHFRMDSIEDFTTPGVSFFMALPCFGEPEHNFKLMLRTAQQIADDLGGHVLDDNRNLMSPNKLDEYRTRVRQFTNTTH
ncbi:cell division protein ZipA [Aliivibrio kagoshimensis]|uniref:cell division protein ZipA n=1 Tax=Aliivibrio kagoshimensis TaxID=2910230 RepID=UPI003D11CDEE